MNDTGGPVGRAKAWGERVRANRAQVERIRQGPERTDFYAPVSAHFVDDPRRCDDAVLDALLAIARPGETWLDIGAGAGRYALPLALAVAEVIAVEPSPGMVAALRVAMAEHGIGNVRIEQSRWPPERPATIVADVALIAHVGYDVEEIEPFLAAMEASARRLCVAVMMERSPASLGDSFWPAVHAQERLRLPALPEFIDLLQGRGASAAVRMIPRPNQPWPEDQLLRYLRQQLWVAEGSDADERLLAEIGARAERSPGGLLLDGAATRVGLVTWEPALHS